MKKYGFWLTTLLVLLVTGQVSAQTRYITDINYVPMRTGPGNEYRIIHRGLRTGTALVLLEEDAGNGFSRVRNGEQEGFVPTQFLMDRPPAFRQLPAALEQAQKVAADNQTLEKVLDEREGQLRDATVELEKAKERWQQQQIEMKRLADISAEPLAIERRNRQLVEENEQLKNQLQVLQVENHQLNKDNKLRWFLTGGGTIVLGILLGLFLPMLKVRKKESAWV